MKRAFLFAMAVCVLAFPAMADSLYSATATVFSNPNFCPVSIPGGNNSLTPIESAAGCNNGVVIGYAEANAGQGHVGTLTNVLANSGVLPNLITNTFAELDTSIVFSGPGAAILVDGMDIHISGVAGAFGGAATSASVAFNVSLNGTSWGIHDLTVFGDGTLTCHATGNFICPTLGTTTNPSMSIAGLYQTQPVLVPLNTQVPLQILLQAGAGSFDLGGMASVDFGNSLDFPIGVPLFNLPAGYTANAPDMFIFDNQFLPPVGTPEPATWWLAGIAIALMVWVRRHPTSPHRRRH